MAWFIFQIYQAEQIRVIFFFLSFLLFFLSFFFFSSFFMLSTSRHIYDIIEDTEHVRHTECRKKKTYIYIYLYIKGREISLRIKNKEVNRKIIYKSSFFRYFLQFNHTATIISFLFFFVQSCD